MRLQMGDTMNEKVGFCLICRQLKEIHTHSKSVHYCIVCGKLVVGGELKRAYMRVLWEKEKKVECDICLHKRLDSEEVNKK